MMPKLTKTQREIAKELKLIERGDKVFRCKNFILVGKLGSGKTFLLKKLGGEAGFEYINFTTDCLENLYKSDHLSFRYLDSNDFLGYVSDNFTRTSKFYLLDGLGPIIVSLYQNGGRLKLSYLFKNFFTQKPKGNLLLSIPDLSDYNLNKIIEESQFSNRNIFHIREESVQDKLAEEKQLPRVKINEFKNNHYFNAYRGG